MPTSVELGVSSVSSAVGSSVSGYGAISDGGKHEGYWVAVPAIQHPTLLRFASRIFGDDEGVHKEIPTLRDCASLDLYVANSPRTPGGALALHWWFNAGQAAVCSVCCLLLTGSISMKFQLHSEDLFPDGPGINNTMWLACVLAPGLGFLAGLCWSCTILRGAQRVFIEPLSLSATPSQARWLPTLALLRSHKMLVLWAEHHFESLRAVLEARLLLRPRANEQLEHVTKLFVQAEPDPAAAEQARAAAMAVASSSDQLSGEQELVVMPTSLPPLALACISQGVLCSYTPFILASTGRDERYTALCYAVGSVPFYLCFYSILQLKHQMASTIREQINEFSPKSNERAESSGLWAAQRPRQSAGADGTEQLVRERLAEQLIEASQLDQIDYGLCLLLCLPVLWNGGVMTFACGAHDGWWLVLAGHLVGFSAVGPLVLLSLAKAVSICEARGWRFHGFVFGFVLAAAWITYVAVYVGRADVELPLMGTLTLHC